MDYLQYFKEWKYSGYIEACFKPYYKWITFNTFTENVLLEYY